MLRLRCGSTLRLSMPSFLRPCRTQWAHSHSVYILNHPNCSRHHNLIKRAITTSMRSRLPLGEFGGCVQDEDSGKLRHSINLNKSPFFLKSSNVIQRYSNPLAQCDILSLETEVKLRAPTSKSISLAVVNFPFRTRAILKLWRGDNVGLCQGPATSM